MTPTRNTCDNIVGVESLSMCKHTCGDNNNNYYLFTLRNHEQFFDVETGEETNQYYVDVQEKVVKEGNIEESIFDI